MPKNCPFWRVFWKSEACGQTVLPDRSVLIGQKLVENAKIKKFKCDILSNFQTMWDFLNIELQSRNLPGVSTSFGQAITYAKNLRISQRRKNRESLCTLQISPSIWRICLTKQFKILILADLRFSLKVPYLKLVGTLT